MILKVFILVIFLQLCVTRQLKIASKTRKKRDEFWSWGYLDETEPKARLQELPTTMTTERILKLYSNGFYAFHGEDPCDPYVRQMPDFSAPGRRISQVKCYEFIWDIQYRHANATRVKSCTQKRKYEKHLEFLEDLKKNATKRTTEPPETETFVGLRYKYFGEYPHLGGIGWISTEGEWLFKCIGSLISSNFVLTAAHCTRASTQNTDIADPVPKIVRLGDIGIIYSDLDYQITPIVDANIRRIVVHPLYRSTKKYYNIALLELDKKITQFGRLLHPGCLWGDINQETFGLNWAFYLGGCGGTGEDGLNDFPYIEIMKVDVLDSALCDKQLRPHCNQNWCGLTENQICAEKLKGVDGCKEEFWSWGYVDDTKPRLRELPTTAAPTESPLKLYSNGFYAFYNEDPCDPYVRQVPDFSAPGRRISQVKCYEFIWNTQYRQEKKSRDETCGEKKKYERDLKVWEAFRRNGTKPYFFIAPKPYGGRRAYQGEFPHMGGIGWISSKGDWIFKCGGSLISPKFVLTAAHCTKASTLDPTITDPVPKIVRLGDIEITNSDTFYQETPYFDANISRIVVHPLYQSPKKYYDIALLELDNEITEFSRLLHPGCLWGDVNQESFGLSWAALTGWGTTEKDKLHSSPYLLAADVDLVDSLLCDKLLRRYCNRNWCGVTENQICAGNLSGGVDACQGDSGGPLQKKIELPDITAESIHFIIGVISFGVGCALPNTPGVYIRVASFIDWIESIVWP